MNAVYYISSVVAVIATAAAITGLNPVHSLLYLIVSFLAVALVFFTLGAPVIAALEVIIYAGAIIVLFIFVVMILNIGNEAVEQEKRWTVGKAWIGPGALAFVLIAEVVYVLFQNTSHLTNGSPIQPSELGATLFGPYMLGVELASMVLLAGLIGAYHLGRRRQPDETQQKREEPATGKGAGGGPAPKEPVDASVGH
ncbi:MAG: NADH-quinone oxidoreductase subunit J [Dehalococcoidia bacterium]|jgi:NADH-quinone oxidoreductase subunit J